MSNPIRDYITLVENAFLVEGKYEINQFCYGSWIDTNNRVVYDIREPYGHGFFFVDRPDLLPQWKKGDDPYVIAYQNGWVRTSYTFGESLNIQGYQDPIGKAWPAFRKAFAGRIGKVNVEVVAPGKKHANREDNFVFKLPEDRATMDDFFRNLAGYTHRVSDF